MPNKIGRPLGSPNQFPVSPLVDCERAEVLLERYGFVDADEVRREVLKTQEIKKN